MIRGKSGRFDLDGVFVGSCTFLEELWMAMVDVDDVDDADDAYDVDGSIIYSKRRSRDSNASIISKFKQLWTFETCFIHDAAVSFQVLVVCVSRYCHYHYYG